MAAPPAQLEVLDLGRMPYAEALALQRARQQEVIAGRAQGGHPGFLLLVEHDPPVITVSRRAAAGTHLLSSVETLSEMGIDVHETDRGGDITYHGPGQLVAYPILDLNILGLRLHGYMRWLEDRVCEVLGQFGIQAHRDEDATGVWVGATTRDRKICALGIRVSRWVSMHGLALNVSPAMDHFKHIVPCGLHGRGVTSMHMELGDCCPSMDEVKSSVSDSFLAAT